jgi:hypothetical protein
LIPVSANGEARGILAPKVTKDFARHPPGSACIPVQVPGILQADDAIFRWPSQGGQPLVRTTHRHKKANPARHRSAGVVLPQWSGCGLRVSAPRAGYAAVSTPPVDRLHVGAARREAVRTHSLPAGVVPAQCCPSVLPSIPSSLPHLEHRAKRVVLCRLPEGGSRNQLQLGAVDEPRSWLDLDEERPIAVRPGSYRCACGCAGVRVCACTCVWYVRAVHGGGGACRAAGATRTHM